MLGTIIVVIAILIAVSYNIGYKKWRKKAESKLKELNVDLYRNSSEIEDLREELQIIPAIIKVANIFMATVSVIIILICSVYTQDPGQASVLTTFNKVSAIDYDSGLRFKLPWQKRTVYDIRNNSLSFVGTNGNTDNYSGGDVNGPQITFQDANGVTGDIDLNARYSIKGETIGEIYSEFKSQKEFVDTVIAPTIRSLVREVAARYDTAAVYSSRDQLKMALTVQVGQQLGAYGVELEELYLQEVRYPDDVVQSFTRAQAAKAEVDKARAEQEKAKVEAETNKIKSSQLTDAVLKEKLIDAIKNGNGTYIIDTNNISIGVK